MLSERRLRLAAGILALAGIGVATYIAIVEGGGGAPKCLAGGHGCQTVADSSYSHLAGINVAVIGIAGYLMLLAAALIPGDRGRVLGFFTSLIGFGFSLYLTYLELFVIDAICQWCVASAGLMTLSLLVAALRVFRPEIRVSEPATETPSPAPAAESPAPAPAPEASGSSL